MSFPLRVTTFGFAPPMTLALLREKSKMFAL